MEFEHEFIDALGGYDEWGAAAAADFDGDGVPEFVTGGRGGGFLHLYDYRGFWARYEVTHEISPNVGAAPIDVDDDGRPELVLGDWHEQTLRESRGGTAGSGRYEETVDKSLYWVVMDPARDEFGSVHRIDTGLTDPHDVLTGDVLGAGSDQTVVRNKDGALTVYIVPEDPTAEWEKRTIEKRLSGDGTYLADLTGDGTTDIVTNQGWFEREEDGFTRHPIPFPDDWDDETRLSVGDVDGDGVPEVVLTESEVNRNARLAVASHSGDGHDWDVKVVIKASRDRRGLHSLQIADIDDDGQNEIVSAEMENGKTDGQQRTPVWFVLSEDEGKWSEEIIFDANLGAHEAKVADFDNDGDLEVVGKIWHPNLPNGNGTNHHVSWLDQR